MQVGREMEVLRVCEVIGSDRGRRADACRCLVRSGRRREGGSNTNWLQRFVQRNDLWESRRIEHKHDAHVGFRNGITYAFAFGKRTTGELSMGVQLAM